MMISPPPFPPFSSFLPSSAPYFPMTHIVGKRARMSWKYFSLFLCMCVCVSNSECLYSVVRSTPLSLSLVVRGGETFGWSVCRSLTRPQRTCLCPRDRLLRRGPSYALSFVASSAEGGLFWRKTRLCSEIRNKGLRVKPGG